MNYPIHVMAFVRDGLLQPVWVQLWFLWMTIVIIAVPPPLLWHRKTRLDGLVAAVSAVTLAVLMPYWHAEIGYTRLLGLPHFVVWVPFLAWLYWRRKRLASPPVVRWTVLALVATILVCLAFDTADIIRYWLGDTAPTVKVSVGDPSAHREPPPDA